MKRLWMSIALLAGTMQPTSGFAFPELSHQLAPSPAVAGFEASGYNFESILALSGCSGSLVRFDDSQDSDQALALTNGHCVRMLDPGEILVDQPASRNFDLLGGDNATKLGTLHTQRLLYAAMTKTDIGFYELKETYQQISAKYHTDALVLARNAPQAGTAIEVISGYWKRGYSCNIETTIYSLKEGDWMFYSSLRYSRPGCNVIGGTSGSPVIEAGTRTVVAINNTINESGSRCTTNNPCEIDQSGNVLYKKGNGYAQQIYWLYTCRDSQGKINLDTEGCLLARPGDSIQGASRGH